MRRTYKFTKEFLYKEYIINKRTYADIANQIGCCINVIMENMYRFDIIEGIEIKKEDLNKLYCLDCKTSEEIARLLKCNTGIVSKYINIYKLKRKRSPKRKVQEVIYPNKRFGKLVIIDQHDNESWNCLCDCGKVIIVKTRTLMGKSNAMKSCGCEKYVKYNIVPPYVWRNIIKNSKRKSRTLEFKISLKYIEDLFLLQNGICPITGITLEFHPQCRQTMTTASLDRIDSSKGYIEGNLQWIDKDINRMKWDLSEKDFINLCRKVIEYHNKNDIEINK